MEAATLNLCNLVLQSICMLPDVRQQPLLLIKGGAFLRALQTIALANVLLVLPCCYALARILPICFAEIHVMCPMFVSIPVLHQLPPPAMPLIAPLSSAFPFRLHYPARMAQRF